MVGVWTDASPHPADVIDLLALGDWTHPSLVGPPMSADVPPRHPEARVPLLGDGACPQPVTVDLLDLRHEAVLDCHSVPSFLVRTPRWAPMIRRKSATEPFFLMSPWAFRTWTI